MSVFGIYVRVGLPGSAIPQSDLKAVRVILLEGLRAGHWYRESLSHACRLTTILPQGEVSFRLLGEALAGNGGYTRR